ncbi:MAG: magnesium transporter, partial [Burkholderiales bacterium]|nr:magnesium transporter [Burkholderiales bacterium]
MIDTSHKNEREDPQAVLRELRELLRQGEDAQESAGLAPAAGIPESHYAQLRSRLDALHSADVASVLEALPLDERLIIWDLVKAERDGEILLEVSDAVRETLIESMDSEELVAATEQLDTDEIADLAPDLPEDVLEDVFQSLSAEEREQLRAAMSYAEDTVGALMDFDMVSVREDVTL